MLLLLLVLLQHDDATGTPTCMFYSFAVILRLFGELVEIWVYTLLVLLHYLLAEASSKTMHCSQ
jgi:hypothetical protein